jgi:benzoyl-CoA reductase/2-hydroxyglutaryl-CoA dehydratase subunit BcrC/BadD/HgdB
MAAGGVPVCLCGGSAKTIAPAEEHLPSNLCPLIKSTYGYHLTRGNPFIEMADLIVAETTCDGKKKMYELMGESRPMYVLELPQKPDEPGAVHQWAAQLRRFKAFLESRWGVIVSEQRLRDAIALMNRERRLRRELAGLMRADRPALSGRQLLELKSSISGIPADLEQYEKALATFSADAAASANGSSVRVLLTGVPVVHGAERVIDIIEQSGGLIVCADNCTGVKPILEDVDEAAADPIEALAVKYLRIPCSVMTPNHRRMDVLRDLARSYRPDCVIELIWQACLTYDVESHRVRRLVEQELKLPYLRIETDYSPSDSARIQVRVQALYETARARAGQGETR